MPHPEQVIRVIPPSYSAFMNRRVTSFFVRNKRLYRAAVELAKRDVLFVGDISRLSLRELVQKLGKRRDCASEIERALADVGISLDAHSPWWKRPRSLW